MSKFLQTHIILSVPQSGDIRTLMADMNYLSDLVNENIVVKSGLRTDLGSIPQLLQNIFPKDGKAMFAYILHDHLYKIGMYERDICDDILEEAMEVLGVNWFTRKSVRSGLKIGGWVAWNAHRKRDDKTPLDNKKTIVI